MLIIGLSGKIGSGKTTITNELLRNITNSRRRAFADNLKEEISKTYDVPIDWFYSLEGKKNIVEPDETKDPTIPYTMNVRELMQWYGTSYRRSQDTSYWVKAMAKYIQQCSSEFRCVVIVDDIRFRNEADLIKDLDGFLIRIDPYDGWKPSEDPKVANHPSETDLDEYPHFDLKIRPKFGGVEQAARDIIGHLPAYT